MLPFATMVLFMLLIRRGLALRLDPEVEFLGGRVVLKKDSALWGGDSPGIRYLRYSFSRVSQQISMSFSSFLRLHYSSCSLSSLLLFSSQRTMLMLSTSLSENWSQLVTLSPLSFQLLRFLNAGLGILDSSDSSAANLCSLSMDGPGSLLFKLIWPINSICWLALFNSQLRSFTCFLKSRMILDLGSSLTTGWLLMYEALVAQVRVDRFYSKKASLGLIQAIMRLQELPPIDCFRIEVSLESLQGTCTLSLVLVLPASARILITCLSVNRDLLMSMLYLASLPSVPVSPMRSEPARSTSSILLCRMRVGSEWWKLSSRIVRMEWLRDEDMLSLWAEFILFFSPYRKYFMSYSSFLHSKMNKFSTVNYQFLLQRSRSPPRVEPRLLGLREAGFSKSNTFQLYICRKETEIVKVLCG